MKPFLEPAEVAALVADALGEAPTSLERLVEGMESQAFRFLVDAGPFVVRINASLRGFEKDAWAASNAGAAGVPVPVVIALGRVERELAYCITEWAPGVTLQDLSAGEAERVAADVAAVWRLIGETDVSSIRGFGAFDPNGTASSRSWHDVLATTAAAARRDLGSDATAVVDAYERLIDACPEEAALVHGDFGSNNVLSEGERVTAVLDWDQAMVGDPLHDVANCYFWATHLTCMQVQAEYFERTLSHLPAYRERIVCYALRIGLEEAREHVHGSDSAPACASWALARSRQLVLDLVV